MLLDVGVSFRFQNFYYGDAYAFVNPTLPLRSIIVYGSASCNQNAISCRRNAGISHVYLDFYFLYKKKQSLLLRAIHVEIERFHIEFT